MLRRSTWVSALVMLAVGLAAAATGVSPAGAVAPTAGGPSVAPLVSVDDPSGSARSLRTSAGHPLGRPAGLSATASAADIARAVVSAHATDLAISSGAFATRTVRPSAAGGTVVRLQQLVNSVPVMGGEVVVDLDAAGNTRSAHSETLTSAAPTTRASIASSQASATALSTVATAVGVPTGKLSGSDPALTIYDPRIFGAPGVQRASLVWSVTVRGTSDPSIDHLVLVDATKGMLVLDLDQLARGKQRYVCDQGNSTTKAPCSGSTFFPVRSEGSTRTNAVPDDTDLAYDYAGITYDFYATYLGRDSVDNAGLPLRSTVRYCPTTGGGCPSYRNAFWDGTQMYYGSHFASADDVVAHELTHGVTQYNSNLFYFFQSGAINESISDIFGEFVDQTDTAATTALGDTDTDSPAVKWQLGEDIPGGAIRDMKDPTLHQQPDKMSSPFYETHPIYDQYFDAGGVHTNSGIGNKFAYLLTDGDTFNGHTVTGIGIPKAAPIIYNATKLLTSGADYPAFASALRSSCAALVGQAVYPSGVITAGDCTQVNEALFAVEMDQSPASGAPASGASCPSGQVPTTRFSDSMENPASGTWAATGTRFTWTGGAGPLWFYGSDLNNPYGTANQYATTGVDNLWGDDPVYSSDHQMAMTRSIAVPTGASYLVFQHAFGFDADGTPSGNHAGGVVEYSTNNGSSWVDAGPLMAGAGGNGYGFNVSGGAANSALASDNPTPGKAAFTRQSQGYVTSRATLSSLAGSSVRFRFRITSQSGGGNYGWFVDDVKLYSCGPLLQLAAAPTVVFGATRLAWPANDATGVSTTFRTRSAGPGKALPAYSSPRSAGTGHAINVPFTSGGGTTCVEVTSRQTSTGLVGAGTRCLTLPVDDRALRRAGKWSRASSSGAYLRSMSSSSTKGASLTLAAARGTHLVLVAEKLRNGGTVGVYVKGKRVALIRLTASRTLLKQVIDLRLRGLTGGPVVLKVETSGHPVVIDGVAVRP